MIMKLNLKLAAFALLAVMPLTLRAETGGGNFAASQGQPPGRRRRMGPFPYAEPCATLPECRCPEWWSSSRTGRRPE